MKLFKFGVLPLVLAAASVGASAAEVVVTAGARDFQPAMEEGSTYGLVRAQPGDTIVFKNMVGGHNTHSVAIPEGAQDWSSELGKDFHVSLEKPGAYVYICQPHESMGMAGVILVGDGKPANLDALAKSANATAKRMGKKISKLFP
jgi:pseudoazurin